MTNGSKFQVDKIYFVWNEDFSLAAAVRAIGDILKGKHACSLCAIAYNRVIKKPAWKDYCQSLQIVSEERYRNQLTPTQYQVAKGEFPVVLADVNGQVVMLLSKQAIDSCNEDLNTFKQKLTKALNKHI